MKALKAELQAGCFMTPGVYPFRGLFLYKRENFRGFFIVYLYRALS